MKKSFVKIIIPSLLGIALLNTACKKYLYEGPITSTYETEFWSSQSSVEQATVAMYGQLRNNLRATYGGEAAHFVNGDLVTGTFYPIANSFLGYSLTSPAQGYSGNKGIPFYFAYVPYWAGVLNNWSRYYQLIAQANLILENVPKMQASAFQSEAVRKQYLAEALFMRSYAYFYMIRIWGDPVYVNKLYKDIDYGNIPPLARTAESVVLDSCLGDLKKAALNFTTAVTVGTPAIRANAGSNNALIAHIYAWKHQYDSAHVYCQKVINNYGYALESMTNYTNLWQGVGSAENIFEIAMTVNNNDPNFKPGATNSWTEAQFNCFATFLKGSAVSNQKTRCWVAPQGGIADSKLFDTAKDTRFKRILQFTPAANSDKAGYLLQKYTKFTYQDSVKRVLPYFNNNLVLFRLSDIYLLDAEALTATGDLGGASAALSKTEIRAGITSYTKPTDKISMVNEIIAERGRELIGEGCWFYDLIRTEQLLQSLGSGGNNGWLVKVSGYRPDRTDASLKGYYWPLDMTTLFPQNSLLTQNPYFTIN